LRTLSKKNAIRLFAPTIVPMRVKGGVSGTSAGAAIVGVGPGAAGAAGVEISMDGRGRLMDNFSIEPLWRSSKYEEVHLKAYADGREARADIGSRMAFYNFRRPRQAMNNQMPTAVWDKNRGGGEGYGYAASLGQR
jgi:hypothetical protein